MIFIVAKVGNEEGLLVLIVKGLDGDNQKRRIAQVPICGIGQLKNDKARLYYSSFRLSVLALFVPDKSSKNAGDWILWSGKRVKNEDF
jgi:hypothetical protein